MSTKLDLSGNSALVTGSTSGIGLGIARRLAAAGANVMVNGLGEQSQIDAVTWTLGAQIHGRTTRDSVFEPEHEGPDVETRSR